MMTDADVINLLIKYQGSLKWIGYENEGREDLRDPNTGALYLGNPVWEINLGTLYYRKGQETLLKYTGPSIKEVAEIAAREIERLTKIVGQYDKGKQDG